MAKRRYYRSRKYKNNRQVPSLPTPVFVVIPILILVIWAGVNFGKSNFATVVMILLGIGVLLGLGFCFSWWWRWRRRRRRQRSLQLSDIDNMHGITFEHYVADLLKDQGYSQVTITPPNNDFGADILCQKNGTTFAIQVKRHHGYVGVAALYQAIGGKDYYNQDQAMVITNSFYSTQVKVLADKTNSTLIDRNQLADWITQFQAEK